MRNLLHTKGGDGTVRQPKLARRGSWAVASNAVSWQFTVSETPFGVLFDFFGETEQVITTDVQMLIVEQSGRFGDAMILRELGSL